MALPKPTTHRGLGLPARVRPTDKGRTAPARPPTWVRPARHGQVHDRSPPCHRPPGHQRQAATLLPPGTRATATALHPARCTHTHARGSPAPKARAQRQRSAPSERSRWGREPAGRQPQRFDKEPCPPGPGRSSPVPCLEPSGRAPCARGPRPHWGRKAQADIGGAPSQATLEQLGAVPPPAPARAHRFTERHRQRPQLEPLSGFTRRGRPPPASRRAAAAAPRARPHLEHGLSGSAPTRAVLNELGAVPPPAPAGLRSPGPGAERPCRYRNGVVRPGCARPGLKCHSAGVGGAGPSRACGVKLRLGSLRVAGLPRHVVLGSDLGCCRWGLCPRGLSRT